MGVEIFNANVGLEQMLPTANVEHLEKSAQIVASRDINEVKLSDLYQANTYAQITMGAFVPSIETDEVLQPANMNNALHTSFESLSAVKDAQVQAFIEQDLKMVMENQNILREYLAQGVMA